MAVLTLDQIKDFLRYDDTSNDDALTIMLNAGQRWIENYTGHLLVEREVTEGFAAFPSGAFDLRYKPYKADTLVIGYLDADLALNETFDAFTIYAVNGTSRVIANAAWPGDYQGVSLTYTAGYADVDAVPEDLLHALCIYTAMSDDERASPDSAAWVALEHILSHYRLPVLA